MPKGQPKRDSSGQFTEGTIPSNKIILPKKKLERLYQKMGSKKIADFYGISKQTVLRNLHEYKIIIRKVGSPNKLPKYWREALKKPKSKPNWSKGQTKEVNASLRKTSEKLLGRYKYPEKHENIKVECACGCGELIDKYDKKGRRRYYKEHHCKSGKFTSERVNGENNYNWKGGISPINTKIRRSKKYNKWRDEIYKRDYFKCQMCGSKKDIIAHHIKNFADYPDLRFDVNNGMTLCRSCHLKLHRQERREKCPKEMELDLELVQRGLEMVEAEVEAELVVLELDEGLAAVKGNANY